MAGHRDGALWGSLVSEALCMGPHWIYDIDALQENYTPITGYTLPTVMDYHVGRKPGDFTHLGDQALLLLDSIEKRGGFNRDGWAADWRECFESYEGYHDAATKQTLRHLQAGDPVETAGSDSTELAGASRIAAVVYHYWDSPEEMMRAAREQTDVTHHTEIIVDAASFIVHALRAIQAGQKPVEALRSAAVAQEYDALPASDWIEKGIAAADTDSTEAIGDFGRACDVRFSFPSVAQLIGRYEDDYRSAQIANAEAGGDSAARALMLGLILGAYHGVDAIPEDWLAGLSARDRVQRFVSEPVAAD